MKVYMTVTFIILFLTSAVDVVRVQLRASAVCPRPSSRANGALHMRSHVGLRAGQEASKKRKTCCPCLESNYYSSVVLYDVRDLITSPNTFISVKNYVQQVEEPFNTRIFVQLEVSEFVVATNVVDICCDRLMLVVFGCLTQTDVPAGSMSQAIVDERLMYVQSVKLAMSSTAVFAYYTNPRTQD